MTPHLLPALLLATGSAATAQEATYRPIANVGPLDIDFGEINIAHRAVVPVTIRNLTGSPMTLAGGGVASSEGFGTSGGSCSSPLAAGASCTFNYHYQPNTRDGTERTASTSLTLDAGGRSQSVDLSFRGRGVGTMIDFSPSRIDFGEVLIGQTVSVAITLQNPLTVPVTFAGGGFSSANGFGTGFGTCSGSLAAGASCTFIYTFTPGAQGRVSNATSLLIGLASGAAISQFFPIDVSGTGVLDPGLATVSPVDSDFGIVRLGRRAETRTRTANVTAQPVMRAGGGLGAAAFAAGFSGLAEGSPGCSGSTIDPGATCTTLHMFTPPAPGTPTAETGVEFSQGANSEFQTLRFEGSGVGPLAQVWPVDADLGDVDLGTTAPVTVTVRNDGEFDLLGFVGGSVTAPFSAVTTCTGTLVPGAQCTYTFTYEANAFTLGPHQMQSAISFGNSLGAQRTQLITIRANGTAVQFRNGFE